MKIGIIDMGTNTFNLLIAELDHKGGYKPTYRSKVGVKLGDGSFEKKYITEESMQRAFLALDAQITAIKNHHCDKVLIFATSAVRGASNADIFVDKVKERFGITIRVIDGDREAGMIYNGVQLAGVLDNTNAIIMDIGGGSTEFVAANDEEIIWMKSYELGVSRLLEKFKPQDPISPATIREIEDYLESEIADVLKIIGEEEIKTLIGSSGSFDTFSDVILKRTGKFDESVDEIGFELSREKLDQLLDELIASTVAHRQALPGMVPMRVNMIVVSAIFVRLILQKTAIETVKISRYTLKEGVLFEVLKGNL